MARAVDNDEIGALAEAIGINPKLGKLGMKLGFDFAAMNMYKARNHADGRVTSEGTEQMLIDWRDKTPGERQRSILKKALEDAGLINLAERHLRDTTRVAATAMEQGSGKSERETHTAQQPHTHTQSGISNSIIASGSSTVSGNNVIGQQNNIYL